MPQPAQLQDPAASRSRSFRSRVARGWVCVLRRPINVTVEQLALAASLYWLLFGNRVFFSRALDGANDLSGWIFGAALVLIVFALHFGLLLVLMNRWTARPVLALMLVVSAIAGFYVEHLGVYIDVPMIRNVLQTNVSEARELLTWALAQHVLLYAGLPLLVLVRVRIVRKSLLQSAAVRSMSLAGSVAVVVAAALVAFQPLASFLRNHKELRYTVTPSNWLWATTAALAKSHPVDGGPRRAVATDAISGPTWVARSRPRLLVLVVGETARAANWGLNGYARDTTPALARLPVVNFGSVTACGTSTEVSLPCMFSLVGRRQYDEERIRRSESVLHVVARAGVNVQWIDNQSGCKGVCDGLPTTTVTAATGHACDGDCLDDQLVESLDLQLDHVKSGTTLVVLHMIGQHGPAYYRRYPAAHARFAPACADDDLRRCAVSNVVNAYDNALAYTDHVLGTLIEHLAQRADQLDAALLFVSDHGESLGEKRLFLHGMPYAIAPDEQLKVPMAMWMSPGFATGASIDLTCLGARAARPASHDDLAHTVLGLLDVYTRDYVRDLDLTAACRGLTPPIAAAQSARAPGGRL